jgi:capsular exopolysaccharide synthesis family protein
MGDAMSWVKKALDKAKRERELPLREIWEKPVLIKDSLEEEPEPDVVMPEPGPRPSSTDISPPTYSQTRTVRVDQDKLINAGVFSILEKDLVADQYKLLRTMILNRTRPLGLTTIEITSFKQHEGKSLTCVNLAIALARETRQTVLLVDTDLRQPRIHEILGIDLAPGLKDYFTDDVPLKDMLVHPDIETLTVLPAGGRINNSTEVIGSHRMEQLVAELKGRYKDRYILFDTPGLDRCPDALVLSSYVDGIVLVVRGGYTTAEDISAVKGLLKDKNVLGVVLNDGELHKGWTY